MASSIECVQLVGAIVSISLPSRNNPIGDNYLDYEVVSFGVFSGDLALPLHTLRPISRLRFRKFRPIKIPEVSAESCGSFPD